jgi:hypothetical protein
MSTAIRRGAVTDAIVGNDCFSRLGMPCSAAWLQSWQLLSFEHRFSDEIGEGAGGVNARQRSVDSWRLALLKDLVGLSLLLFCLSPQLCDDPIHRKALGRGLFHYRQDLSVRHRPAHTLLDPTRELVCHGFGRT